MRFTSSSRITKCGRECTVCGKWKTWSKFSVNKKYKTGHEARCRDCISLVRPNRRHKPAKITSEQLSHVRYKAGGKKKTYQSEYMYLYRYGITRDDALNMLRSQGSQCAICQQPLLEEFDNRWHVDHNHNNGRVRGILCCTCNTGLGKFMDDPGMLRKAANYVQES